MRDTLFCLFKPVSIQLTIKIKIKIKINSGGREGVGRSTGLPLWTCWVGREPICLLFYPLLLHLAFVFPGIAVGTQGFVACVYCAGVACCIVSFFNVGDVHLFCCTIKAFKNCPSTSEDDWEQHYIIPFSASNLHSSACCSFFSMTLSMYLVSEEYPNSMSHTFLGLPYN
jgi:hypothetical protein